VTAVTEVPPSGRSHPERVPDFIVHFFRLFPECLPRARDQHHAAEDGLCAHCGKASPCSVERWIDDLVPEPTDREAPTNLAER
jgi:hypothetical protein